MAKLLTAYTEIDGNYKFSVTCPPWPGTLRQLFQLRLCQFTLK